METDNHKLLDFFSRILCFATAFYLFSYVTADPDLWGHLKFGADHWQSGHLARTDLYSFTAHGNRWINHEWLAELLFYLTYRFFGDPGLLFGKLVIGLSIVWVLLRICDMRRHSPLSLAFGMILAVYAARKGFMIRPQLFSFLFFALFLYLFHLYFFKYKNRLFFLPLLMAVWVNLHGGFIMGWALVIGVTGWKTLERIISRKPSPQLGQLWIWLLAVSLATLANPYGYRLLVFLYQTLSVPRAITEWEPINVWNLSHLRFKLMAVLFFTLLVVNFRRVEGWEAAALVAILFAAFRYQRHTPFFAMAAVPFIVHRLTETADYVKNRFHWARLGRTANIALAAAFLILSGYQLYNGLYIYMVGKGRIIVDPIEYPVGAVRFLKLNGAEGNLLLPFTWGEYAIWHLYPFCRVSIDGRFRTVYPESVIKDHFIHQDDTTGWKGLLEKYPADIIISQQSRFFHDLIGRTDEWVYVYSDRTAIVFLRENEKNAAILQRFREGRLERPNESVSVCFP
jgi:hypothetical protein